MDLLQEKSPFDCFAKLHCKSPLKVEKQHLQQPTEKIFWHTADMLHCMCWLQTQRRYRVNFAIVVFQSECENPRPCSCSENVNLSHVGYFGRVHDVMSMLVSFILSHSKTCQRGTENNWFLFDCSKNIYIYSTPASNSYILFFINDVTFFRYPHPPVSYTHLTLPTNREE